MIIFIVGLLFSECVQGSIPERCQASLDTWCNHDNSCVNTIKNDGYSLPLYARNDTDDHHRGNALRCYSPSSLSVDLSHYVKGSAYCTRPELSTVLNQCLHPDPHVITVTPTVVFTADEIEACKDIRTPELVVTENGTTLLFAQCRSAPLSTEEYGDNFLDCKMVMKSSMDGGKTWSPLRYLSERGTGVGAAVYVPRTNTVVLQYQKFHSPNPYTSNTLLQVTSSDDGSTWSAPKDITEMIAGCNKGPGGLVCGGAGSRIVTSSGRLVFSGHNGGHICVWYSDDDGSTYKTSTMFAGDENSIAELPNGTLYMNGRYQTAWKGYRTSYYSHDGGATWSAGHASTLTDVYCDAALVSGISGSGKPALYFSEPHGPGRTSFRLSCSLDGGISWPHYIEVNQGEVAAYSALWTPSKNSLLAVWEQQPNQLAYVFNTTWCS